MLLEPGLEILTGEKLIGTRWTWGKLHEKPITTSFYFGEDGLIKTYRHHNERSWRLENGILKIYNDAGSLMWSFEIMFDGPDGLVLISRPQIDNRWAEFFVLTEHKLKSSVANDVEVSVEPEGAPDQNEGIRLVIWDLDETFWKGTLSEEGVTPIEKNIFTVKTLNRRGIVNAICSKNNFEDAKAKLEEFGVWGEFVFPRIEWSAKGPLIKSIISDIQLRPEAVLFIDDNVMNLNEAKHFVPKLNISEPSILNNILDDTRFVGKSDPELRRLTRYKILQEKNDQKSKFAGGNEQFLRQSGIRVSFHTDVEAEFPRIHELVNRTNQLNFTKNRWPEDAEQARQVFHKEATEVFLTSTGYVKVSDAYGNYGICGFYMVRQDVCQHLLFSCRTMNMGVEQWIWNRLGRPYVPVRGDVVSDIDMDVDWISVVPDADEAGTTEQAHQHGKLQVCIRGACDMQSVSDFLRIKVDTIQEMNYSYQGWEICALPRIVALHEELQRPDNQAIIQRLPGLPPRRFETDIIVGKSDVYILSFSQESFHGLYRSKSTGMILPMGHYALPYFLPEGPTVKFDYTSISYGDLLARGVTGIGQPEWEFFIGEFEFLGGFKEDIFVSDINKMLSRLVADNKTVIIVGLNSYVGRDKPVLAFFDRINRIVRPIAEQYGIDYIDIGQFFHDEEDLAPDGLYGGPHFSRQVYFKISEEILKKISNLTAL